MIALARLGVSRGSAARKRDKTAALDQKLITLLEQSLASHLNSGSLTVLHATIHCRDTGFRCQL